VQLYLSGPGYEDEENQNREGDGNHAHSHVLAGPSALLTCRLDLRYRGGSGSWFENWRTDREPLSIGGCQRTIGHLSRRFDRLLAGCFECLIERGEVVNACEVLNGIEQAGGGGVVRFGEQGVGEGAVGEGELRE
jgi:hypothetical protein